MVNFFKPNWQKILLFSVFMLIAVGGQIQTWAFDKDPQTKPPLYDLLKPLPLWLIWAFSIAPLIIIFAPFRSLALNIALDVNWLWWIVQVIYYYTLSCFCLFFFDIFRTD